MFSRKEILSALTGVAMLALPASGFAAHYDNSNHRQSVRNQFFARDLNSHQYDGNRGLFAQARPYNSRPAHPWARIGGDTAPILRDPVNYGPAYQPNAWNGYRRAWLPPAENVAPNYGNYAGAPALGNYPSCGSTSSTSTSWLMNKRHNAMSNIARLRARGDSRGANRLVPTVTALNRRINGLGRYGCGSAPSSYAAANPLIGSGYNSGHTGSPTFSALSSVAPLLGGIH